ncbi:hypothetical protein Leryth_000278 [Lithospermum erythrorhizon]|nr:hypothetical protein Leryth_000278 [Lithospermum erythrorhizon]
MGQKLNSLISEKITIVPGDITFENLGVKDSNLLEEMCREVDVVVNVAATTNFDERYDVSLALNTFGAINVLNFAKKCVNLKVLLHVSTAYVAGEKSGLILESPYKLGESLNGTQGLDPYEEKKLVDDKLKELSAENASPEETKLAMKELGIQRARKYGWPNTYVFTKTMGEMLVGNLMGNNMPLVIIRPTIITSTYKDPFPGWAEGVRTIDSLVVGYGTGKLTCFLGNPTTVIDVPSNLTIKVAHAKQPGESIYNIGSSVSNPIEFGRIQDIGQTYFINHPWINKEGKPVIVSRVKVLDTMEGFQRYMNLRYMLPLKGLQLLNAACCQYFHSTYYNLYRKVKFVYRLVELYVPYLFFEGIFDDMNTEKLRRAAEKGEAEMDLLYFDPKIINWEDYFTKTHIPGIVKYVFK